MRIGFLIFCLFLCGCKPHYHVDQPANQPFKMQVVEKGFHKGVSGKFHCYGISYIKLRFRNYTENVVVGKVGCMWEWEGKSKIKVKQFRVEPKGKKTVYMSLSVKVHPPSTVDIECQYKAKPLK